MGTIMAPPQVKATDRRLYPRYPVEVALEYKAVLGNGSMIGGTARVVDLSTGGILFETSSYLPVGLTIQLSIAWPQGSSTAGGMTLDAIGKTVRNQGNYTAVLIQEHEFRPARKGSRVLVAEPAVGKVS